MKNLVFLIVIAVVGFFGWRHFQAPGSLEGRPLEPGEQVVTRLIDPPRFDVTDKLEQDVWTLVFFGSPTDRSSLAFERELEVAVREKHDSVKMVIVHVRDLSSPAAVQHSLDELPTLWLFKGLGKRSGKRESIERLILSPE